MTKTEFEGQLDDLISKGRADGMTNEAVLAALVVRVKRMEPSQSYEVAVVRVF